MKLCSYQLLCTSRWKRHVARFFLRGFFFCCFLLVFFFEPKNPTQPGWSDRTGPDPTGHPTTRGGAMRRSNCRAKPLASANCYETRIWLGEVISVSQSEALKQFPGVGMVNTAEVYCKEGSCHVGSRAGFEVFGNLTICAGFNRIANRMWLVGLAYWRKSWHQYASSWGSWGFDC